MNFLSKFFNTKAGLKSRGRYATSTSLFNITNNCLIKTQSSLELGPKRKLPLPKGQLISKAFFLKTPLPKKTNEIFDKILP